MIIASTNTSTATEYMTYEAHGHGHEDHHHAHHHRSLADGHRHQWTAWQQASALSTAAAEPCVHGKRPTVLFDEVGAADHVGPAWSPFRLDDRVLRTSWSRPFPKWPRHHSLRPRPMPIPNAVINPAR